ncbi:MAG TPA: hypothetical protein VHV51_09680 [Polyangiaceae bacterium]|nr:hypothetical protein [Polyangiaceae bacterium]
MTAALERQAFVVCASRSCFAKNCDAGDLPDSLKGLRSAIEEAVADHAALGEPYGRRNTHSIAA